MNERVWVGRVKRITSCVISVLGVIIFVGYWIISWPTDLLIPSILTITVVLLVVANYLILYWTRAKTKILQYWGRIKTRLQ